MGFKIVVNQRQLPIKLHYFFFMTAMGPILPFLTVYGKQMGLSTIVMGAITAILPMLYLISKPVFGYTVDYFRSYRKTIFLTILIGGSLAFVFLYFLPITNQRPQINIYETLFSHPLNFCHQLKPCNNQDSNHHNCTVINYKVKINCQGICDDRIVKNYSLFVELNDINENGTVIPSCLLSNININNETVINKNYSICETNDMSECNISCKSNVEYIENNHCLYRSYTFWMFVLLLSIGSVSFNVINSISDAVCFDILGEDGCMGYGRQRVWGSIGFGLSAFIAGHAIDIFSKDDNIKSYTPSFILVVLFTCLDVICCQKLKLPKISSSKTIAKDIIQLLRTQTISIFLTFATIAGIIDSFIIYFLFWYMEDLAAETNYMHQIKLIEGLTVAAETLGGEVIIFLFSGKILKAFGYGYTLTFCFICYALRLGLISLAPNPWWIVLIEFFMQGPTYALCYTIIVSMASVIAPPGTSATMQGIAAGMDDGFGFAIGSLLGGILYKEIGGLTTFRVFSAFALIIGIIYLILYIRILKNNFPKTKVDNAIINDNTIWKSPEDAIQDCETADNYNDDDVS